MSGMILNWLQPNFAVANEMQRLKAMYCPVLTEWALIFDLNIFWAICYWRMIIYYVTDLSSITQSRRSALKLKFSVLTFLTSLSSWNEQKMCVEKIFQLQFMSNAIIWIDKSLLSRILVYLVWPWYSAWAMLQWQSCTQKIGSRLQNMTSHIPFFSVDGYRLPA